MHLAGHVDGVDNARLDPLGAESATPSGDRGLGGKTG